MGLNARVCVKTELIWIGLFLQTTLLNELFLFIIQFGGGEFDLEINDKVPGAVFMWETLPPIELLVAIG